MTSVEQRQPSTLTRWRRSDGSVMRVCDRACMGRAGRLRPASASWPVLGSLATTRGQHQPRRQSDCESQPQSLQWRRSVTPAYRPLHIQSGSQAVVVFRPLNVAVAAVDYRPGRGKPVDRTATRPNVCRTRSSPGVQDLVNQSPASRALYWSLIRLEKKVLPRRRWAHPATSPVDGQKTGVLPWGGRAVRTFAGRTLAPTARLQARPRRGWPLMRTSTGPAHARFRPPDACSLMTAEHLPSTEAGL